MVIFEELLLRLGLDSALAAAIASAIRFVIALVLLSGLAKLLILPLVNRALHSRDLEAHVRRPLLKVVWGVTLFGTFAIAFGFAGYGNVLTSLATVAAAATLAIGLATQSIISNFVAGVLIFIERPFRIGDWIEWDGGNYSGVVEDISLRVTRVRTFDNELVTVPNTDLTSNVIKNPVAKDKLRLKFVFGIGYEDDIEHATDIILDEAMDNSEILDDPEPVVRLTELGESDVGLESRFWIADPSRADFIRTRSQYVRAVKERFDNTEIDIPYPHRTLVRTLDGQPTEREHVSQQAQSTMD
jgi:small conductance mechanosensitive channel